MKKEPLEVSKNVIDLTTGKTIIKRKTDKLIADICNQIDREDIPMDASFAVLITLGFSLLYNQTQVNKKTALKTSELIADAVYKGVGL